jgi:glutathione S-transferase
MLIVHHLGKSQSERIVWLCEELGLPYELEHTVRDPVTMLAAADYKALHPIGSAPVIIDGGLVLAESGAIVEYISRKCGNGRLVLAAQHPNFADFL